MEALFRRSKTGIQNMDGSQKPLVLYDKPKAEPQASEMGAIPLTIQLYIKAYPRKEHGKGRWPKQKAQLAGESRER